MSDSYIHTFKNGGVMHIPLRHGVNFDDESWEIWVHLDGSEMFEFFKAVNNKSVRVLIASELQFRANDIVWNGTEFNNPTDEWAVALENIERFVNNE